MTDRSLLPGLLPPFVGSAEGEVADIRFDLRAEEAEASAQSAPGRRAEFAAGRALARAALAKVGGPDAAIPVGEKRAPRWPAGYTGSITHAKGYAAAAVARLGDVAAIGVDIEDWTRFRRKLEPAILTEAEIEALAPLGPEDRQIAAASVFSAKESFYKAQHPLTGAWIGFHDAVVELMPDRGVFRLRRLAAPVVERLGPLVEGRYRVKGERVATAVVLPARAPWPGA